MHVIQATPAHLEEISCLFDAYRQFYGQAPDHRAATRFIAERLEAADSVIFLARNEMGESIGFTQLYPAFSSVAMKRMWYLNDLYIVESADALTVKLATAVSNHPAKSLYESEGYQKVIAFEHYTQRI